MLTVWQMKTSYGSALEEGGSKTVKDVFFRIQHINFTSVALFLFLSVSRLGLWVFDLTTQEITQTGVSSEKRSSFAGTETALVSLFELIQWVAAAIWSKPEQFKWLSSGSLVAVTSSMVLHAFWVRHRRGHLVHLEKLHCGCSKG